jgi:benzoyl-CoA reductase/2-hydroxyglutaryl-CoA dehydratase subunit BcrC/BadD/HgdB
LKDKEITFKQWKKVQDGEKYRHKEVQEVREKAVFLTEFESELDQFEEHVGRVKHQYEELRKLRKSSKRRCCSMDGLCRELYLFVF